MSNDNAREARSKFQKANNGPGKTLVSVDKRIRILENIRGDAVKAYMVEKESFKPGEDRQKHEVHLQAMNRDIKAIQAARDELAALLG